MSAELGIIVAVVSFMFFMAYNAYKIIEVFGTTHEPLSLLFILAGIVSSWIMLGTGVQVAQGASLSQGVINVISYAYNTSIVIGALAMIYFAIRLIVMPLVERRKNKESGVYENF